MVEDVISPAGISKFINDGYVRIDNAFPSELAEQGREILWREMRLSPDDPSGWTRPVVRLGERSEEPFRSMVNTERLHRAFDQLVGNDRWTKRMSLGSFPIRFPGDEDPGDTGWHVDASFPGADPHDFMQWRINVKSRGRALLMLFLLSHVSEADAPTRIRPGSHLDVARELAPAGSDGISFMDLAEKLSITDHLPEVTATGEAGTVYLCHPFLAHAAQPHRGSVPKFMAQPPLAPSRPLNIHEPAEKYYPVEVAIRNALGLE